MTALPHNPSTTPLPGIDPRGPRFAAALTACLLLVGTFFALLTADATPRLSLAEKVSDPGFMMLAITAILFAWGFTSPRTALWGVLFRKVLSPRLTPPVDREDPRLPRFAQVVGFIVVTMGLLLHLAAVPWALPIAGGAAFVAAFLNAAFGLCLGCQLYLVLAQAGLIRPRGGLAGA